MTIKDIAKLSNVSIATVSMIINKKDERISQSTRERVLAVIEEHGYIPNKVASSMITKSTNSIGLILPDITNPFFPELARGVEDCANELGYHVILCNSDNQYAKETQYIEMLQEKMVDGIILTTTNHKVNYTLLKKKIKVPIVTVDRNSDHGAFQGAVYSNNEQGAFDAVTHMIERGYECIVYISGPLLTKTSQSRYAGYLRAFSTLNLTPPQGHLYEGLYNNEWGYYITNQLIQEQHDFDGLFCADDLIALGALKALAANHLSVPDQVGVVGFDDINLATLISPELTTVHQPIYEMGYKAAEYMISLVHSNADTPVTTPYNHILDTQLKIRGTTR